MNASSSSSPKVIGLEEGWEQEIKVKAIDVLEDILNGGLDKTQKVFPPKEYMQIYTTCYNMCTQRSPYNWSEQLYQRHGETIQKYLQETVLPALRDKHDEFLLRELRSRWNNHKIMNKWLRKFFMYLDRYYVRHHSLPTLDESGLERFKTLVFDEVKKDTTEAMLAVVNQEREGQEVDRALLRSCVEVFESMGMGSLDAYNQDFEDALLSNSETFYARKSQEWVFSDGTPEYLIKAERVLQAESERVKAYMHVDTEPKLLGVCEAQLLEKHERTLLDKEGSGCRVLLANDKLEDLARMFRLFSRVPDGLPPIATMLCEHITAVGNAAVERRVAQLEAGDKKKEKDAASDPAFVKELLKLHDKYKSMVAEQFDKHMLFQKALKDAFVEFSNCTVGKHSTAELLSSFCDRILKSGGEKLSDADVEDYCKKVVDLFSYLTDKDLFAEIYRNQLAKRLLNLRSASDDAERQMIAKLKMQCGAQFTGKMEGMMNDLRIGSDHKTEFKEYLESEETPEDKKLPKAIESFAVQVLTTGYWPTYKAVDVALPPLMAKCTQVFAHFYDTKTSHRRLTWIYQLGDATLRANYARKYDLVVTTLQAVALLEFNGADEQRSFEQLREAMNLPAEYVKRVMHSLSCGKYKLLTKTPQSKSISTSDTFKLNGSFACPKRKIRIPMASLEESHSPRRVEEDRSIAIEAAVVRIMKSRKTLQHQQLVAEVLAQLSFFRPNVKVVKRRIEALIEREYLERAPDTPNTYRYLA
eukprot:g6022.t1